VRFFSGELDNLTVRDLVRVMDNSVDKFEDRNNIIREAVEGNNFFSLYFDTMYPKELSQDDVLSIDDNVCQLLERYGSYLINSRDLDRGRSDEYTIYYDENEFQRALRRSVPIEESDRIPFFVNKDNNYKKAKDQKITSKDLSRDCFLGRVLRDYQKYIDTLNTLEIPLMTKNRIKGDVQRDMIISKDQLLGVFGYKLDNTNETTCPDYSFIDFTNPQHLKGMSVDYGKAKRVWADGLLRMKYSGDLQSDFQCILYDLDKLIEKTPLTPYEQQVLSLYRKGYTGKEIGDINKVGTRTSNDTIDRAINKITKKAKELGFKC